MNKSIKYLIEDYLSFNPNSLKDDKPKPILNRDIVNNAIMFIPKSKEELEEHLKQ